MGSQDALCTVLEQDMSLNENDSGLKNLPLFYPVFRPKGLKIMIIVYKLIKEAFTQNMICTLLVVECFPPCFLWNVFLQVRFCKVFYRACGGISSHKACCGPVPTSLVGLAYNSKSCFLIMCITFLSLTFIQ